MKIPLSFYIDVSGQPTSEIFVGLISIHDLEMSKLIKSIKEKYPFFIRNKQKASKMQPQHIKSIISFLNNMKVRMSCIHLKSSSWNELIDYVGINKQNKIEMIFAVLYFIALEKYSQKENIYPLTICIETFMDIDKVMLNLKKLAKAHNRDFQISKSQARYTEMIKFADIVAGAGRKITRENLKYEFFYFETPDLEKIKFYLRKLK